MGRENLLIDLYLFGRRIRSIAKKHNEDKILTAAILSLCADRRLSVSSLAALLSSKVSAVSEKIIALEIDKLVKKKHGANRREMTLELTSRGMEVRKEILARMDTHCSKLFKSLSDHEFYSLNKILHKLLEDAESGYNK